LRSFDPERNHWVDPRRAARREVTCYQRHQK
jgi:hypothetical protein